MKRQHNTMLVGDYTAAMTFDADDKIIVGRVLGIDDIIVFHAKSVSEFEKNFQHVSRTTLRRAPSLAVNLKSPQAENSCFASRPRHMQPH